MKHETKKKSQVVLMMNYRRGKTFFFGGFFSIELLRFVSIRFYIDFACFFFLFLFHVHKNFSTAKLLVFRSSLFMWIKLDDEEEGKKKKQKMKIIIKLYDELHEWRMLRRRWNYKVYTRLRLEDFMLDDNWWTNFN